MKPGKNRYPEVQGKTVEFIETCTQPEGASVAIRFTDKTNIGFLFTSPMIKLHDATLTDISTGDYEMIKDYTGAR
jgi:hypothetical protein